MVVMPNEYDSKTILTSLEPVKAKGSKDSSASVEGGSKGDPKVPSAKLPTSLFLLPVAQTTMFPGMVVPVILPEGKISHTVEEVLKKGGHLGVVIMKNAPEKGVAMGSPTSITGLPADGTELLIETEAPEDSIKETDKAIELYPYGVAVKIIKRINLPDNQVSLLLSGVKRFRIDEVVETEPMFLAKVEYLEDKIQKGTELEALLRSTLSQFKQFSKENPLISEEIRVALVNIDGPGKLSDLMASVLVRDVETYQRLLSASDVTQRLEILLELLKKEIDVQSVQKKIQDEINEKVSGIQRDYYLQEQLKAIQKELGKGADEKGRIIDKFLKRLEGKDIPKEAKERIDEELDKLGTLHEQSSEYSVSINYLDWATALPWGVRTEENFDISSADKILNKHHHGLQDVKDRILEFLAVKKLRQTNEGSIICFVGPPGTGKTSLGKSIASALNRKFFRFSVGGMRDEAEIKGHRRTYVGAMPGKIIQGLKRMGSQNPVFLIDEIDKMGNSWASGGDPSSALLEVLDPEQNKEFLDHFLDISFDCSEVLFITTANTLDTIPSALLDRMEVIELHGYTDGEKQKIARRHLIPRQFKKNGLKKNQLEINQTALKHIISQYARESGVRNLEKLIGRVCRKVAYKIAMKKNRRVVVDSAKKVQNFLGTAPFSPEVAPGRRIPGVITGLAWTQYGGEVLYVESSVSPGKGGMTLTGSLGDVMKESASISYTYIRDKCGELGLDQDYFDKHQIHLHVPSGATPKDGPSAGVTMACSLYSLFSNKAPKVGLAMTGELTLSGRVLPVGGIKEKLLAAKRSGMKKVLLPKENERDLREISDEVKRGLTLVCVASMEEVLTHVFGRA